MTNEVLQKTASDEQNVSSRMVKRVIFEAL